MSFRNTSPLVMVVFVALLLITACGKGGGSTAAETTGNDGSQQTTDTNTQNGSNGGDSATPDENGTGTAGASANAEEGGYAYAGTVRDGGIDGPGLAQATVTVGSDATVVTGNDGSYSLSLAPGAFPVTVTKEGYVDATATITIVENVSGADWYLVTLPVDGSVNTPPAAPTITGEGVAMQQFTAALTGGPYAARVTPGEDPDGDQVSVRCSATGSNYGGKVWESNRSDAGATQQLNIDFVQAGAQKIGCQTVDSRGGTSEKAVHEVQVEKKATNTAPFPPYIDIFSAPYAGDSLTISVVKGIDRDGDDVSLSCDLGGGFDVATWTEPSSSASSWSKTVTATNPGNYTITCFETDINGARSDSSYPRHYSIRPARPNPNHSPYFNAANLQPPTLYRGEFATVTVSIYDPDGDPVGYRCLAPGGEETLWSHPLTPGGLLDDSHTVAFAMFGYFSVTCTAFDSLLAESKRTMNVSVLSPHVTDISPRSASVGVATTFTVIGSLPNNLEFAVQHCDGLTDLGGSHMGHAWSCTPNKAGTWKMGVRDPYDGANLLVVDLNVN